MSPGVSICQPIFLIICCFAAVVRADVHLLTRHNFDSVVGSTELILMNFYADWCHFSRQLAPIFEDVAKEMQKEYTDSMVKLAKVDCENPDGQPLGQRFAISKYPTIKLFRHGELVRKEYRGMRTVDAFASYIRNEMKDPLEYAPDIYSVLRFDDKARHIVGLFTASAPGPEHTLMLQNMKRLARSFKDDCKFHAYFGDKAKTVIGETASHRLSFYSPQADAPQDFTGNAENLSELEVWARERCIPIVREITFENAEELTEEGTPFLILFYNPDNYDIVRVFTEQVKAQIPDQRGLINPVYADGMKFSHPLAHLGKSTKDLPILAIDSFKHMYLFPFDVASHLAKPGILRQFVMDLHSGKLHREFHQGPDPTQAPQIAMDAQKHQHGQPETPQKVADELTTPTVEQSTETPEPPPSIHPLARSVEPVEVEAEASTTEVPTAVEAGKSADEPAQNRTGAVEPKTENVPITGDDDDDDSNDDDGRRRQREQQRTDPPESMFAKLQPSRMRYTLLKDEL